MIGSLPRGKKQLDWGPFNYLSQTGSVHLSYDEIPLPLQGRVAVSIPE